MKYKIQKNMQIYKYKIIKMKKIVIIIIVIIIMIIIKMITIIKNNMINKLQIIMKNFYILQIMYNNSKIIIYKKLMDFLVIKLQIYI